MSVVRRLSNNEKGSLALEQVLFIGAVAILSAGVWAFYGNMGDYFGDVEVGNAPSLERGTGTGSGGTGTNG